MPRAGEKEVSGRARFWLRCVGVELVAEAAVRMRVVKAASRGPDQAAIEDQSSVFDGDIVEDIDEVTVSNLNKL